MTRTRTSAPPGTTQKEKRYTNQTVRRRNKRPARNFMLNYVVQLVQHCSFCSYLGWQRFDVLSGSITSPNALSTTLMHQLDVAVETQRFFLYPKACVGHHHSVNHVYSEYSWKVAWAIVRGYLFQEIAIRIKYLRSDLLFHFCFYVVFLFSLFLSFFLTLSFTYSSFFFQLLYSVSSFHIHPLQLHYLPSPSLPPRLFSLLLHLLLFDFFTLALMKEKVKFINYRASFTTLAAFRLQRAMETKRRKLLA